MRRYFFRVLAWYSVLDKRRETRVARADALDIAKEKVKCEMRRDGVLYWDCLDYYARP